MKHTIEAAISAHQAWTETFLNAIEQKKISEAVSASGYDDLCAFGKWLYSLDDKIKRTPNYRRVKDMHYRFHAEAAEIVSLMNQADFAGARARLAVEYADISTKLLALLNEWKNAEAG